MTDVASYDAFVIGSAVYLGRWRKDATEFAHQHQAQLAGSPVWLFSSGPLGTATQDDQGRDLVETSQPKEFEEFAESIKPRDLKVFFGALDPTSHDTTGRLLWLLPAGRTLLPEGDFRDSAHHFWVVPVGRRGTVRVTTGTPEAGVSGVRAVACTPRRSRRPGAV